MHTVMTSRWISSLHLFSCKESIFLVEIDILPKLGCQPPLELTHLRLNSVKIVSKSIEWLEMAGWMRMRKNSRADRGTGSDQVQTVIDTA